MSALPGGIRHKARSAPPPGESPFEYVLSDGSVDRVGDIIEPSGWQLGNFRKNPVALFGHDPYMPIGTWQDVRILDERLVGRLELMPPVTEALRHIHAAVAAGVLRATSVGFQGLEYEPFGKSGGLRFTKSELVEVSLVSVPANPNALAIAKAIGIPRDVSDLIFGELADVDHTERRGINGGLAEIHANRKPKPMSVYSERIETAQTNINALRDQLAQLASEESNPDLTTLDQLNEQLETEQRQLEAFQRAETNLGAASEPIPRSIPSTAMTVIPPPQRQTSSPQPTQRTPLFAQPKKKDQPSGQDAGHALIALVESRGLRKPVEMVLAERGWLENANVRTTLEWMQRAATNPATSTTATWAAELAQIMYGDYLAALTISSVFNPLSALGEKYSLGRFAQITLPVEQTTPTIAGSFVAEGAPIPVRQGAFTTLTLGLKKMAVITTYTREIFEHSTPTIDAIVRSMIQRHTSVALDTILLDNNAATSIRPAGLRSGVSGQTPTAGGGFNALVGDIKNLLNVLISANSLRSPVFLMNPQQKASIGLTQSAAGVGVFPFKAEIDQNMLIGYPVISSPTVPATMVILLDAADFISLSGDEMRFDVSDQATLHMEDTTPLAIGTPGSPNTVAAPVRSMFQTDTIALRMILPMNWAMRRTGLVAWVTGVTW